MSSSPSWPRRLPGPFLPSLCLENSTQQTTTTFILRDWFRISKVSHARVGSQASSAKQGTASGRPAAGEIIGILMCVTLAVFCCSALLLLLLPLHRSRQKGSRHSNANSSTSLHQAEAVVYRRGLQRCALPAQQAKSSATNI